MATPLLEWISDLLRDPHARAEFYDHPDRYCEHHGFQDLSSADVHDALALLADDDRLQGDHGWHFPPPGEFHHDGHHGGYYLRGYIDSHRGYFDQHDTDIDNSVHQHIDTGRDWDDRHDRDWDDRHDHDRDWRDDRDGERDDHDRDGRDWRDGDRDDRREFHGRDWDDREQHRGGEFHQVIDNDPVVASGHGSIAAHGDIRDSVLTSGHGNVVGGHNQAVTGHDNSTAFGSGDATSANIGRFHGGDGSSLSIGGDSHGFSDDSDTETRVHTSGSGSTSVNAAGEHGYASELADQRESDSSTHSAYTDDSHVDSHDELSSHNDARFTDSHDVDVHHI